MKNNIKTRLLAALLCVIMLFSTACNDPGTTTQPTTTLGGTTTAPENTATTAPPEHPENGVRKIVSQIRNVYSSAEKVEEVTFAHYEDTPDILLMDTETAYAFIFESLLSKYADYVIEETDTTLTITRDNGAYCVLDFVADSIYFNNFDLFRVRYRNAMSDLLTSQYVDSKGNEIYFHREDSMDIAGDPVYIDLAAREIPLDIYEGKKYVPFQTLNDLFISPFEINYLFNSEDVFRLPDNGVLEPALVEKYYSVSASERSEALANFTVHELCLVLDLYYGLKDAHGVTGGFEDYIARTGLSDELLSADPTTANTAIATLLFGYVADMHSSLVMTSPYTGSPELDYQSVIYNPSLMHYWEYYDVLAAAREEAMPDGVPGYQEVGNTAYVTFDSFYLSMDRFQDNSYRVLDYSDTTTEIDDTISLIIYAHSMITRENSPIENVVLDLSCNGGGHLDTAVYVVAWMLGYCDLHMANPITNSVSTTVYTVDVNLDGVFDEKDTIADKNLYCMISPLSFSCGNFVPALLKESGLVTLVGDTSGGGACAVQIVSTADGSVLTISTSYRISTASNGAFYTIDRGVEPHVHLVKPESYFDRQALTEYLNNLK